MNLVNELLKDSKNDALIDGGDIFSYDKLKNTSLRISNGLNKNYIKPGDHVVLLAHNSTEFIISYLAALASGAVVIPLDPYLQPPELARDMNLVKPDLIITSSKQKVPIAFLEKIQTIEFHSKEWKSLTRSRQTKVVERDPKDIAVMMMTSGASYQPRPAMLSHESMIANLKQAYGQNDLKLNDQDIVLSALPMYHIFGLHVVMGFSLYCGATQIVTRTLDAVELAYLIDEYDVTVVPGVPALFENFTTSPNVTLDSLNRVRLFISGGAPMRSEVKTNFAKRFGPLISEGYGLTEASPMVSFNKDSEIEGNLGQALENIEIDIRDPSGTKAEIGDAGQIVIRGPNIFSGYYRDSATTNKVLDSNGWLYTGDIGVKNTKDQIILLERSSDVIVVNGFSVFPSEVENILLEHSGVLAVSVVGELDEKAGEVPVAHIVIMDTKTNIEDPKSRRTWEKTLYDHCLEHLARYKVPVRFEFVQDLSTRARSRPLRKSLRSALKHFEE